MDGVCFDPSYGLAWDDLWRQLADKRWSLPKSIFVR